MAASPVGMKRFYSLLAAVAVVGIGLLGYQLSKPATVSIPANVQIDVKDTANFHGYVKGDPNAPVEITEYADYQCPFCQTFATLQMPTIEERLIKTGRLRWRYRDFPLQQHPFSRVAAHSAACADDQGKFWQQHEQIYNGQAEWSGARDAAPIFRQYAQANGLDLGKYDACMSGHIHAGRIQASLEEGMRVGVQSTPTLMIGNRLYQGRFDSDAITRLVDSLAPKTSSAK
ncbi:MAG TPA: thioredoxin domain-containing protein [Gemmatimonadales bacterium]|jgi:protein-disulfide isomerase|nr:thioredoxin domain-containing protein [Gemmatimonadales bacterium]